eukprot:CAMPEP_0118954290 /NCGR_PEP_ID=MMETSP1169-20130426/58001_1 /TAXON_ID=36882 /ORGANISM="Pyramimonas obovata, Strain CCMP722" /LENGTH=93 /DNA_ID=CAMNT_0006901901 /DNA_START=243 /DNA_END=520 /DNA_ORIENTATION=+
MATPVKKLPTLLLKDSGPATLINAELERIIQGSSARKHPKLQQDCRALIELFGQATAAPPTPGPKSSTPPAPSTPTPASAPVNGEAAASDPPV